MMGVSPEPEVKCDKNYHEEGDVEPEDSGGTCGSVLAFPYFISFYVLCSFLVSFHAFHGMANIYTKIKVLKLIIIIFIKIFFIYSAATLMNVYNVIFRVFF